MFALIAVLILLYNVGYTLLFLSGGELSITAELLYRASFICGVGWWLQNEIRRHKLEPLYCRGLLIQVGWPILIPYYLLKTRGLTGLIPLAILIAAFVSAQIIAAIIYAFATFSS